MSADGRKTRFDDFVEETRCWRIEQAGKMETIQKEIVAVKLALAGQPNLVELAGDVKQFDFPAKFVNLSWSPIYIARTLDLGSGAAFTVCSICMAY